MEITLLYIAVTLVFSLADAVLVRVCVPERGLGPCEDMKREPTLTNFTIQCVSGPDRYGCIEKVMQKSADVVAVSGEDAFLARELYDLELHVLAEMRLKADAKEPWRYQGVAVVRRSTIKGLQDLRGSKSCHTGYARTAGWNIPFSHLLEKGMIKMQCGTEATVVEHDVKAAASFFGSACIPGKWTPDNKTDVILKRKYKSLCAMCSLPDVCGSEDPRAGYEGALSCLVDGQGDVAWSKMSAVQQFFAKTNGLVLSDYGLLCPDGSVQDLLPVPKMCNWASRPWNGWLVRSGNENKKAILKLLTAMVDAASVPSKDELRPWGRPVLSIWKPSVLQARTPSVSTRDYLKEHKYDTTIERLGCPEVPIKLCVESTYSIEKCEALRQVLKSRRIRPGLECVTPTSGDCLSMLASSAAHITPADGGDVYRAYVDYDLLPIVSERYGLQEASYFAVAVVRANSGINSLSQLRGKKSCHTGIGRTAGWKIPVVTLLKAGLLKQGDCDFAGQMGHFFSGSCAPGAKNPTYDPKGTNPESLCALCVGNQVNGATGTVEGKCDRGPIEAFSGYTGAFRCLVEGGGDVAFVKQTTISDNTNGNNNASWAVNLRAVDYKLLCANDGAADVVDYNNCHLARVPSHKVLIDSALSPVMKEEVRIMLLRAAEWFPKGQDVFKMFGTFKGKQDLIFKDSATDLINVQMDIFHQSLEDTYYKAVSQLDSCKTEGTMSRFRGGAMTLSYTPAHLLLCLALAWLLAC